MKFKNNPVNIPTFSISEKEKKTFEFNFLFWKFKSNYRGEIKFVWRFGKKKG